MMYTSVKKTKKDCATECIRCFMSLASKNRGENAYRATMLLDFCRLLKRVVPPDDGLYLHCRSALGIMLYEVEVECSSKGNSYMADREIEIPFVSVNDLFPILEQVGRSLQKDLVLHSTTSTTQCGLLDLNVSDFSAFLKPGLTIIEGELAAAPVSHKGRGKANGAGKVCLLTDGVDRLFYLFIDLLSQIEKSMLKMADYLGINRKNDAEAFLSSWSHYLSILKELRNIALLYPGLEVRFVSIMRKNKVVVNALVLHASRIDDHAWLFKLKDVLDFKSRRHLALLMLPEVNGVYEELHEMLIDRSQLLAESFEYIYNAVPSSFQAGLFIGFVIQEAKGPGVVEQMNAEQKKTLLFFWTSVKYLPVEGFRGLASELFIHKSLEPHYRLPSSHTCSYQLCIPTYPTTAIMQEHLQVCRDETSLIDYEIVQEKADQFISLLVNEKTDCYKIFLDADAAQALVMMYMSVKKTNKDCADECIRCFMRLGGKNSGENVYRAMMLLEFCRLLKTVVPHTDVLYLHCRSALGIMLNEVEVECRIKGNSCVDGESEILFVAVNDLFPILEQIGRRSLRKDLVLHSTRSATQRGLFEQNVFCFSVFLKPILTMLERELAAAPDSYKAMSKGKEAGKVCLLSNVVDRLYYLFSDLLSRVETCMLEMEGCLDINNKKDAQAFPTSWSHYLSIFKEMRNIALLYPGLEVRLLTLMREKKVVVNALVVLYATCADDHAWLLKLKDVLDFESRRHLALLMFPEVNGNYEDYEGHEMLIDRSQLLAESFEYIYNAEPSSLQAGLFMGFVNEEAKASKIDPLLIQYFRFAGRVIALALMYKIQIEAFIDRILLLQLAGRSVTVEDIKDADPRIYKSCKQILEMDPEFLDSDALCLTFVTETENFGSREVVELCSGGNDIVVNSKNREEYVDLLVQQRFVTSIAQQVSAFAQGFADILRDNYLTTTFFKILELKDLDWMLHGSESQEISIEDWKAHTKYVGYEKSDPQIVWFWKVVEQLNAEQKKTLLFFWTSIKYLPVEGFSGLASELFIHKSLEPQDRLPSSYTCFYQLCIPTYPTKAIMQDRLRVITQDHVGFSFGAL
ncbi:hypothetical protein KSS87_001502 [Heliosperma pusillum]|nr:hypothetical protein KSS87_001502 [Heliosperma pusillum]